MNAWMLAAIIGCPAVALAGMIAVDIGFNHTKTLDNRRFWVALGLGLQFVALAIATAAVASAP